MRARVLSAAILAALFCAGPVLAQDAGTQFRGATAAQALGPYREAPQPYEVLGVTVEGVEDERMQSFVLQTSGLSVGQTVTIPGDQAFADAIRAIYRLGQFSDVEVVEERRVGNGVFLAIRVQPEPRLAEYTFEGVKRSHRNDLKKQAPLITGATVRPSDIERTKQIIREFYREKGHLQPEIEVERATTEQGALTLTFEIDRGPRAEVQEIFVAGNEAVSDRKIRKQMKETKEDRWWRFWDKETFQRDEYQEDLARILEYYNERGYYDARIESDSVFVRENEEGEPEVVVTLQVHEGPQYHIRDIEWEGNTLYTDGFLTQALGLVPGDVYNSTRLEENLFANKNSTDVASLYMNRGYMRFNVEPTIRVVEGDSLDIHFDVFEGDVYQFGDIDIVGNTKTKEHVIRRELYTVPGQTFSRESIQETIRRLSQLNYFAQESLMQGPNVEIDEAEKKVDLTYKLEETGSDQLELSGTWARYGLVLSLRFNFNNFSAQNLFNASAWKPLPAGDGQKLSVGVQTNGRWYQNYSLGFTEPWFRGRPTPIGFALSYSRMDGRYFSRYSSNATSDGGLETATVRFFYDQRLKWPDDKFSISTGVRYQLYQNDVFESIPEGLSQVATVQQAISRNSQDHPLFPMSGSQQRLSAEIAPPIGNFVQYHKWRFTTNWNVPLTRKISLGVNTDYGYVGSLTGEPVQFERFIIGGSPFDTQGLYSFFGRDIIYMRGYPAAAIGPRQGGEAVGGTVLNRYTSELRWMAVQSQQLQAAPYLFLDAANTWDGFQSYNPAELYRSAGLGVRLFLPILGMLELSYGYNFDAFTPLNNDHDGTPKWSFQFSLGQGLGQ